MNTLPPFPIRMLSFAASALLAVICPLAQASDHPPAANAHAAAALPATKPAITPAAKPAASAASSANAAVGPAAANTPAAVAERVRQVLQSPGKSRGSVTVVMGSPAADRSTPSSREYIRAKAAALAGHEAPPAAGHESQAGHEAHWAYEGENGPNRWGALKPEFNLCAIGKRQSPIHIEETTALPGPAEPLQTSYLPSKGSVVNNGHTIQVDVEGDNTLTVRGAAYKLVQFHFHHPAEEKVNYKGFAMVVHMVHRNAAGQLAVLAVLLDPGAANTLIQKVWTHMPLDAADRVTLPAGLIDANEFLPADRRYYQFMGSLTTPPCTEGVLWLVLKQPMTVGRDQLKLFSTLFPNNARPSQALNGRLVREAQ